MPGFLDLLLGGASVANQMQTAAKKGDLQARDRERADAAQLQQIQQQQEDRSLSSLLKQSQIAENNARAKAIQEPRAPQAVQAPRIDPLSTEGIAAAEKRAAALAKFRTQGRSAGGVGGAQAGGKPAKVPVATEAQANTKMFAERMRIAETRLQQHEASGKDDGWTGTIGRLPKVGNLVVGHETQQYRQAQKDWVRAKLRKESGASISPEEMQGEIETYFPQLGDGPDVIQQKAQARMEAAVLMMRASGGQQPPSVNGDGPDGPTTEPIRQAKVGRTVTINGKQFIVPED